MEITEELTYGLIIGAGKDLGGIVMHDDTDIKKVHPKQPPHFTLEELQGVVGGYIEIVRLPHNNFMVVDEEGNLKGKPLNITASKIVGQPIVGDVIVCGASMVE